MIRRKGWREVKEWEKWLEEHMTEERRALYREFIQKAIDIGALPVTNYLAVTSGSNLDWSSAGSPLPPDAKIPKMEKISMIKCWYCGGPNRAAGSTCNYCGAPLSGLSGAL